jgi:hypothetical protein
VAPRRLVLREIEQGELSAIPLGVAGVFRQWCLPYHHGSELTGMRRKFLKICREEMPHLLGKSGIRRVVREQNILSAAASLAIE